MTQHVIVAPQILIVLIGVSFRRERESQSAFIAGILHVLLSVRVQLVVALDT